MDKLGQMRREVREAGRFLQSRFEAKPLIAVILGSGLGRMAEGLSGSSSLDYEEIPYFPVPLTPGHPGRFFVGQLGQKTVAVMQGRVHLYEGYTMQGVAFPVKVLKEIGIRTLITTNSAGGLDPDFEEGDLMLITDHINLTGENPLIGPNDDEIGPRFPDMIDAYSPRLLEIARSVSQDRKLKVREGIYAGVLGPSYETKAEMAILRQLGAAAVGMSTVSEVITARHADMEVLGISCITNVVSEKGRTRHEDVLAKAERRCEALFQLIAGVVEKL